MEAGDGRSTGNRKSVGMNRTGMEIELEKGEGKAQRVCQDHAGGSRNAEMQVLLTGWRQSLETVKKNQLKIRGFFP